MLEWNINFLLSAFLPSGHEMIVVDHLHERLDTAAAGALLLAHATGDGFRVAIDTGHESVSIALGVGAIVLVVDNHRLAASIFARQQEHHLTGSHNFTHLEKNLTENVGVPKKKGKETIKHKRGEENTLTHRRAWEKEVTHNTLTAL